MRRMQGFTLIELLIVVLIIAILAAIAVPNFLEFQTRAKVSRALADMRSIKTAVEAYCVDESEYIQSTCPLNNSHIGDPYFSGNGSVVPPEDTWFWLRKLTTPISYMSTIPPDPFSDIESPSWYGTAGKNPFHFYSGNGKPYQGNATYAGLPRMMYLMFSIGPDNTINVCIDNTDADAYMLYNRAVHNGGGRGWDSPHNDQYVARPYDPTNGTTSTGDIYNFSTTDSSVWDYFLF